MKKYKCHTIIFSSSASIYKSNGSKILKETDEFLPSTPYGKTKLAIEEVLNDLYLSKKDTWRIAKLRYFNPVGAHNSGLLSENPNEELGNLFPAIIRFINNPESKLSIFGKDWPTKDGTCVRDFIHIMDLADAHLASLDLLKSNDPQNLAINIGTGLGTSILEIIKKFQEIKQEEFPYYFSQKRAGDVPFVVADNSKALRILNWKPKRTLTEMCRDSLLTTYSNQKTP